VAPTLHNPGFDIRFFFCREFCGEYGEILQGRLNHDLQDSMITTIKNQVDPLITRNQGSTAFAS